MREIVRGWRTESGMTAETGSGVSPRNESPRGEWLGETERERVRLVREWVQMASQQRGAQAASRREERDSRAVSRREEGDVQAASRREERDVQAASRREERDAQASRAERLEGQQEHIRRDLLRLRGRQARLDLIMRIVRERQRELQGLSEHRAVSDFAYRNRIQVSGCSCWFFFLSFDQSLDACMHGFVNGLIYIYGEKIQNFSFTLASFSKIWPASAHSCILSSFMMLRWIMHNKK